MDMKLKELAEVQKEKPSIENLFYPLTLNETNISFSGEKL
jgi:hypothetical protein